MQLCSLYSSANQSAANSLGTKFELLESFQVTSILVKSDYLLDIGAEMAKAIRQTRRVIGAFLEIWAIASLLRFLPAVTGDTTVSGRIEVDSTFYAAQQPYALATDLIVSAGATLVIEVRG